MDQKTCGGAFSVQFLANGDQVNVVREVLKGVRGGDVTSETYNLVQRINPDSGALSPDWTKVPPVVCVRLAAASGRDVFIKAVRWSYNGDPFMSFAGKGVTTSFEPDTNGSGFFAKKSEDGKMVYLKIERNIATKTDLGNKVINFEVDYVSGPSNLTANGHFDIDVQQAGSQSYRVALSANPSSFTKNGDTVKITASAELGTDAITFPSEEYSIAWEMNDKPVAGDVGATHVLTVKEEDVESACRIVATLKDKAGNALCRDSIAIQDSTDTYALQPTVAKGRSSTVSISENGNIDAVWVLHIKRLSDGVVLDNANIDYNWTAYNALSKKVGSSEGLEGEAKATVTVTPDMCAIANGDDPKAVEYGEVDIWVTANIKA